MSRLVFLIVFLAGPLPGQTNSGLVPNPRTAPRGSSGLRGQPGIAIGQRGSSAAAPPAATVPSANTAQDNTPPHPGEPLPAEQLRAIVIIKGDYSTGTGFVVKMHNQFFVATNQHVLSGNKKFTLTGVDGTKYPVNGALYGAKDYDVAILQIPENLAKYYLEVDDDPQANTKAGGLVTVPGNADGNGIPVQIQGDLVGIGPEKVEVTAKFIHGNSGSPIIYRPTNKVIGIATEVIIVHMDNLKKAANSDDHHWLGFRLDNISSSTGWVKLDWDRFSNEGLKIRDVEAASNFLITLFTTQKVSSSSNDQVMAAVTAFRERAAKDETTNKGKDYAFAVRDLVDTVRSIGQNKINQLAAQNLYPYHAQCLKEDQDLWKDMAKAVTELDKDINAYLHINTL